LSIFLLLFFVPPLFLVNAQQQSQRWVCLNAEQAGGHSANVSVDPEAKLIANSQTYVFECIANSECTSGNSDVDQQVFGADTLGILNTKYGYIFEGSTLSDGSTLPNPLMSDGEGNISTFTWQSSTTTSHDRRWLALNYFDPAPVATTGEDKTQQVGTFSFESVVNQSDCISLSWDPYGRVFDSKTLEPVKNTSVTLLKKRDDGFFTMMTPADLLGGNILNPQLTTEDGGFSFVVPDGIYKLIASNGNYVFPEQIANLQSNYLKIYSDIYPGLIGEEIVQQGAIQHRDIPLKQASVVPETSAKVMEYFQDLDKATSTVIVKGRVSHPFAKIIAYSLKPDPDFPENIIRRTLPETASADKLGNFVLKVKLLNEDGSLKFEPTESFGDIAAEKIDLTQPGLVGKFMQWLYGFVAGKVNAQTLIASSVRLEPILNHLEGYAYDAGGNVLPNSTVSIYLSFSNKPSYQTKTDDKGYYQISSEFLPSMPYRITYTTSAGQVVKTSTSKFIAQNSDTITASDIKINQFTDKQGKVIAPPVKVKTPGISNGEKGFGQNLPANESSKSFLGTPFSATTLALILTIIVLFILLAVAATVVFIKKRKDIVS